MVCQPLFMMMYGHKVRCLWESNGTQTQIPSTKKKFTGL